MPRDGVRATGWPLVCLLGWIGAAQGGAVCSSIPVSLAVIVEPDPILMDDRLPSAERIDPVQRWRTKRREQQVDPATWALLAPLTRELKRSPPGMVLRDLLLDGLRSQPCTISDTQVFQAETGESLHEVSSLKRRMLRDRSKQDLLIVRSLMRLSSEGDRVVGYLRVFSRNSGAERADVEFDLEFHSAPVEPAADAAARVGAWAADGAARLKGLEETMVREIIALLAADLDVDGEQVVDRESGRKGRLVHSAAGRAIVRSGGRLLSRPKEDWQPE